MPSIKKRKQIKINLKKSGPVLLAHLHKLDNLGTNIIYMEEIYRKVKE